MVGIIALTWSTDIAFVDDGVVAVVVETALPSSCWKKKSEIVEVR